MEPSPEATGIEIDKPIADSLDKTRRWTMFISIVGFIFLGVLIVFGILTGTFLTFFSSGGKVIGLPEAMIIILVFVLILFYFFPVLFLYRFSKHTAHAIHGNDKKELLKAFRNLKSYFVFLGILIIFILVFYLALLIFSGVVLPFQNII